jgi:hypothetical protein
MLSDEFVTINLVFSKQLIYLSRLVTKHKIKGANALNIDSSVGGVNKELH